MTISKRNSLTVSALASHAADPGSNPGEGDFFRPSFASDYTDV